MTYVVVSKMDAVTLLCDWQVEIISLHSAAFWVCYPGSRDFDHMQLRTLFHTQWGVWSFLTDLLILFIYFIFLHNYIDTQNFISEFQFISLVFCAERRLLKGRQEEIWRDCALLSGRISMCTCRAWIHNTVNLLQLPGMKETVIHLDMLLAVYTWLNLHGQPIEFLSTTDFILFVVVKGKRHSEPPAF